MSVDRWDVGTLGQHAYIKGRIGWKGLKAEEYVADGPYLIAGNHLEDGVIRWDRCDHVSLFRYKESLEIALRPGDIILTKDGTIGRVAFIPDLPGPATINSTMMLIRTREPLFPKFVCHYLRGHSFQKLVADKVSGSSIPHIFQRDMATLRIPLPPVSEQRLIAQVLDSVDAAIQHTERLISKLRMIKLGLLHDLLTRGVDENGKLGDPERNPQKFQQTPLGLLPKSWEARPVSDLLADVDPAMRSGPFGSALLQSELTPSGIPLLGIDNVFSEQFVPRYSRFVSPRKFGQLRRYSVRPRDVMITIMGTVGRSCVVPNDIGQALSSKHVWTLTIDEKRYIPELVCLQFNYADWVLRHFRRDEQGGIMSAIRSETLKTVRLPVPPLEEQMRIFNVLMGVSTSIAAEEDFFRKVGLLRTALSNDLLTGRIRVKAVDRVST